MEICFYRKRTADGKGQGLRFSGGLCGQDKTKMEAQRLPYVDIFERDGRKPTSSVLIILEEGEAGQSSLQEDGGRGGAKTTNKNGG